jgi:hypothetical protein
MIDALDECDLELLELLDLITRYNSEPSCKAKWLVASRNRLDIEERLRPDNLRSRISLEFNSPHVSQAVNAFIDFKVRELTRLKHYDENLREEVKSYLQNNAEGTFLWVALVCKELQNILRSGRKTRSVLRKFPRGLEPLYDRMMQEVLDDTRKDGDEVQFCIRILSSVTLTYRPMQLKELAGIAGLPDPGEPSDNLQDLVDLCSSFLTIRQDIIYFVHQSAKDYFTSGKGSRILFVSQAEEHYKITCRLLSLMSETLKRDICDLKFPGLLLNEIKGGINQEPLESIRYACSYWVDHLRDAGHDKNQIDHLRQTGHLHLRQIDLLDGGKVHMFLQKHFLHWLEALSLIGNTYEGVDMVRNLESMLMVRDAILS